MLLAQGKTEEARKLAEGARDRAPRETEPWLFLAELERRKKDGAKQYLAILDEAERRAGRRVEWPLARVRYWTAVDDDSARKQLQALAGNLGRWSEDDHEQLATALGLALAQVDDQAGAEKLWRESAGRRPQNLGSRLLLLESAAMANRADDAKKLAGEIAQGEGGGGPLGCYAGAVVAWLNAQRDKKAGKREAAATALGEARRQLDRAVALRPSWSRLYALLGDIESQEDRPEEAVRKYQAAIDRGEVRLDVWRKLAERLRELRRDREAAALLGRLQEQDLLKGRLGKLSATLTLVNEDAGDPKDRREQALKMARKVVQAGSGDYQDHLWMGQLAWMAGNREEAEQALRKARQVAPENEKPSTWVALVALLARIDRKKAHREVVEAEKVLKKGRDALALMTCHELVGQDTEAEKVAAQVLRDLPGDPEALAEVASFYARNGRAEQAEKLWRQVLEPGMRGTPDALVRTTRRTLAAQLALRGNYAGYKEALALIERNLEGGNAVEDRRIKALVIGSQAGQRSEAIRLFESLSPLAATTPPVMQLLLARLYEADGRWPQARLCLLAFGRGEDRNPLHVRLAALALLRRGEKEEARRLFNQLDRTGKQTPEGIELEARLLHAEGEKTEAVRRLEVYQGKKADRLLPVAMVLESLGENEAAEKLLRRFAKDPKQPGALLVLARHLALRKQADTTAEALRLCEQSWGRARDEEVAVMSVAVLNAGPASDEQKRQVTEKIRAALERSRNQIGLLLPLAELENLAGRYDQAMVLYRRVLEAQPGNEMALNNLAHLLSLKEGKHDEALKLIEALLEAGGPVGEVLDTRGLIHLGAGRSAAAVKDFLAAIKQNPSPVKYFHLARAQHAAGERRAAQVALARARGLTEKTLHPLERPAFGALSSELAAK
jgi:tetratricopeptide (TPR) repeat protein